MNKSRVKNYADNLIRNNILESEYEITPYSPIKQMGGTKEYIKNRPTGGFPPIYICNKSIEENRLKARSYISAKKTVSIGDIMNSRRNKK